MVKGVNKSVIEISDTGNRYFSKVILFVAPEYVTKNSHKLSAEADEVMKRLQFSSGTASLRKAVIRERRRRRKITLMVAVVGALVISALTLWLIL